ncbi:MAG: hypothetical protein IPJ32_13120 [Sphingobacteriaceae bacterium]|nr:hypothetical protein [Sphingobacteriaceae bacterium]
MTYKYNSIVEYNPAPKNLRVKKIIYSTFNSKLQGEKFTMVIENQFGILKMVGSGMDTVTKSIKVSDSKYNSLLELLNYSDFPKIEYDYTPEWEKFQMSTITIYYSDSKIKTIDSYSGMYSYFIMEKIYENIYSIKDEMLGLK